MSTSFNGRLGLIYSWTEKAGLNLASLTWATMGFVALTVPGLALSYALGPKKNPVAAPSVPLKEKLSNAWSTLTKTPGYVVRHPINSAWWLIKTPIKTAFKTVNSTFWFAMRWAMPQALMHGFVKPILSKWHGDFYSARVIAALRPPMEILAKPFYAAFNDGLGGFYTKSLVPDAPQNPGTIQTVATVATEVALTPVKIMRGIYLSTVSSGLDPVSPTRSPNQIAAQAWYEWSKHEAVPFAGKVLNIPRFALTSAYGFSVSALHTVGNMIHWTWTLANHEHKAEFIKQFPNATKTATNELYSQASDWAQREGVDKVCWSTYDAVTETASNIGHFAYDTCKQNVTWAFNATNHYVNTNAHHIAGRFNNWIAPYVPSGWGMHAYVPKYVMLPAAALVTGYAAYKGGCLLHKHKGIFTNCVRRLRPQQQQQQQTQETTINITNTNTQRPGQ